MNKKINIAIDGPGGSGKDETAKILSKKLNYKILDTGAMYRAITFFLLNKKIEKQDDKNIKKYLNKKSIKISFNKKNEVLLNNKNIERKIREHKISLLASNFSQNIFIRKFLILQQQNIIKNKGFILSGRDTTSIVAPTAEVKIYLDCEINERVKRRIKQYKKKCNFKEIKKQIQKRDKQDMKKNLIKTKDSNLIDTTNLTIKEQVEKIYLMVNKIIN